MHLHNTLGLSKDCDTEWLHNIISNTFQVVLVDAFMLPTHALPQVEPKLLLGVDTYIKSQVDITVIYNTVTLRPSPDVVSR